MAAFEKKYNPNRSADWNYGGPKWRLSRSKIELFVECPRCFYLDNKLGTARPRGPAFTLNIAVDALLKKEFDQYRVSGTVPPFIKQNNLDLIPFPHKNLDMWRDNFVGISYHDSRTGFEISGAVDDIWYATTNNELFVVDYKATSKEGSITSLADSSWEEQYKRQIGVYQWLLRKNGFSVSHTGYFVYANALFNGPEFSNTLTFDTTLIPIEGDDSWIDSTLLHIKDCLDSSYYPESHPECEYCIYRAAAGKKLLTLHNEHRTRKI